MHGVHTATLQVYEVVAVQKEDAEKTGTPLDAAQCEPGSHWRPLNQAQDYYVRTESAPPKNLESLVRTRHTMP